MQLSGGFLSGLSKSENKSQCNDAEIENTENLLKRSSTVCLDGAETAVHT